MMYVECNPDKVLVSALGVPKREVLHAFGKDRACNSLKKIKGGMALLDEDPQGHQPPYLRSLSERSKQYGIRILYDEQRDNKIILLCPRLEEWLIETAKNADVNLEQYGLAKDASLLHEEINLRSQNLTVLLESIKRNIRMQTLRDLLSVREKQ